MALQVLDKATFDKVNSAWNSIRLNAQSFVAPTFFTLTGAGYISKWNYYSSQADAFNQLKYLSNEPGTKAIPAVGQLTFSSTGKSQTAGINCDFFLPITKRVLAPTPYGLYSDLVKNGMRATGIVRFYKTTGQGPYYAILDLKYFGISANVVSGSADKIKAATEFYNNLNAIRGEYNALVTFLNALSQRTLDPATQAVFNRGVLRQTAMYNQIHEIKGVSLYDNKDGTIGLAFIPIIIAIAVIGAVGWTLSTWITEREKTRRIVEAFKHQQYVLSEQEKLTQDFKSGKISEAVYRAALLNFGIALETAKDVAEKASETKKGMFGEIGDIVKWVAIGFVGYQLVKRA